MEINTNNKAQSNDFNRPLNVKLIKSKVKEPTIIKILYSGT